MFSHLILKDPLEEPQPTYIERGKLNFNKEFDERTIWTGDCVPLMASYNKAKIQHSLWVVEIINSNIEMGNSRFPDVPLGVLTKQFSFRRIWQGKGSQTAASKIVEIYTEVIYDIKPDMSWNIPAVAAAPVVVTRPGVKVSGLPFMDIVVLTSENALLLYVYLSLYTTIGSMIHQITSSSSNLQDRLFISSLKIALAYNNSLLSKRSTSSKAGIVQSTFLGSVQKRVEEILNSSPEFQKDFSKYMKYGRWPAEDYLRRASTLLSWYVQWYNVPSPFQVKRALDKIKAINTSSVPLLHLLFPRTDVTALYEINRVEFCPRG